MGSRGIFRRLLGLCSMKFHHASRSGACHRCRGHSCVAGVQSEMKCGALMNRSLYFEDVDLCLRITQSGWEVCHVADAVVEYQSGALFAGNVGE